MTRLEPYRPLFLIGLGHALAGTLVWVLAGMGLLVYPGILHRTLMIEGFEQSFIAGFLLTALGGLTHGGRSTTLEVVLAIVAQLGVGVAALSGHLVLAHASFLAGMLVLLVAAVSRARPGRSHGSPPQELIFIVTALVLGLAGASVLIAGAVQLDGFLFALGHRLVALGEVLTLVVGVGAILIPKFLGHRSPMTVSAGDQSWWRSRAVLYRVVAVLLVGSLALEVLGSTTIAAAARAIGVTAVLLGVWKIHEGRTENRLALVLRMAGIAILTGLWASVSLSARPLIGEHILFVGGYGLLTMGIASRVVVAHGGWPPEDETRLLHPFGLIALAISLVVRLSAEVVTDHAPSLWAASSILWVVAWLSWAWRAVPRIALPNPRRTATASVAPSAP